METTLIFRSRARSLPTFRVGLPLHVQRLISLNSFFLFVSVCGLGTV